MKLRRWESWGVFKWRDVDDPIEVLLGKHLFRWGAQLTIDFKLGSTPVAMLWAHGDIEWTRGEIRSA